MIHQYSLICSLSLKFAAWMVKLNFLSYSQHIHITFIWNYPAMSMRHLQWHLWGNPATSSDPTKRLLSGDPVTTLQSSEVPTAQDTALFSTELDGTGAQAALILVTEQSADIGSSTSGAIKSIFFIVLPNTILIYDTHYSVNAVTVLGTKCCYCCWCYCFCPILVPKPSPRNVWGGATCSTAQTYWKQCSQFHCLAD